MRRASPTKRARRLRGVLSKAISESALQLDGHVEFCVEGQFFLDPLQLCDDAVEILGGLEGRRHCDRSRELCLAGFADFGLLGLYPLQFSLATELLDLSLQFTGL